MLAGLPSLCLFRVHLLSAFLHEGTLAGWLVRGAVGHRGRGGGEGNQWMPAEAQEVNWEVQDGRGEDSLWVANMKEEGSLWAGLSSAQKMQDLGVGVGWPRPSSCVGGLAGSELSPLVSLVLECHIFHRLGGWEARPTPKLNQLRVVDPFIFRSIWGHILVIALEKARGGQLGSSTVPQPCQQSCSSQGCPLSKPSGGPPRGYT